MDYLTRTGKKPTNEPIEISLDDIWQMYLRNQADAKECERVTESSMRGESYYENDGRPGEKIKNQDLAFLMEHMYRDAKTSGFLMEYPHGIVIRQAERSSYFRGENKIHEKSIPSLFRTIEGIEQFEDQQLYKLVADMRIYEFGNFLFRLGITQFWKQNYSDVLVEPLAQHYGLETKWLDITSDFMVALFFATCWWDGTMWRPLTKEQTEVSESTKYGMIFHIPQWQASRTEMRGTCPGDSNRLFNVILPIGFQPFMRCHSQNAYGIKMEKPFPLQEDFTFEKLCFRHNEKLSQNVFESMNRGEKIFPQEGLDDFQDIIDLIKNATSFSKKALDYALRRNDFFANEDEAITALNGSNIFMKKIEITGDDHPFRLSRQRIRRINRKYEGFSFESAYGIHLITRISTTVEPRSDNFNEEFLNNQE